MHRASQMPVLLLLTLSFAIHADAAQLPAPAEPFQAVHLLWVDTQQPHAEQRIQVAMSGLNAAIRKAGCSSCTYRLWRVTEGTPGSYNYVQISDWPSRAVYDTIHNSRDYAAAYRAWAELRSVVTREVYSRQSEVPLDAQTGDAAYVSSRDTHAASTRAEAP